MPTLTLPFVGVHNQRGISGQAAIIAGQDQRFVNCTFDLIKNPVTGNATVYVEKRPGWGVASLVAAGSISTGAIRTDQIGSIVSAFGDTNSAVYDSVNSIGTITGKALHFSETIIGSIGYVLIRSSDGTAWYYAEDAATTLTYTGNTHTNTTVDGIASTTGMYSGQAVSGTNIVGGTRILSVDSATAITLDTATTGTTAGVTITKTPIAKILDADFVTTGSNISTFADLDGYLFYCNDDGYLYNSDLGSIISYSASNKIAANMSPDVPVAIARHKNLIICFGNNSTEFFQNSGYAAGSPLSKVEQYYKRVGAQSQSAVVPLEDDIYFVSSSRDGDTKIERLRDLSIQKVSTPHVDTLIGTASEFGSNIYLNAFNLGGYSYVTATIIPASSGFLQLEDDFLMLLESGDAIILDVNTSALARMMVYNVDLNIWNEWDTTLLTFIRGLGSDTRNQIFATSLINTSGKIYLINPSGDGELYQDDGSSYTMTIQTARMNFGTNFWKFIKSVQLVCDKQASGTATLEYSDDDFATWTTWGTFDLTTMNPILYQGGAHQGGRAYRLTHSANTAFRAESLIFDYEVGTS